VVNDIRKWLRLVENIETVPVLYHGTCADNAEALTLQGWYPKSGGIGGNMGQARYLYLSTEHDDALWFAQEKGCDAVVIVRNIPISYLIVDPEDGTEDSVKKELNLTHGIPGKLALTKPLSAAHFEFKN